MLSWDKRDLRKRADKIEKDKHAPPKEVREELRNWISRSRAEHDECRRQSKEQNTSIVAVIVSLSSVSSEMTEEQHAKALEYLSLHLAVRDRQEIIRVLCKRNPDILTSAIRDAVDAYTPIIRHVHEAVNLSDSLWDLERFLTDMLKISKPSGPKGEEKAPGVEAFVDLLHRHQGSLHKFLHQVAKNGKEVTSWFKEWSHMAASMFRNHEKPPPSESVISDKMVTGGIQDELTKTFTALSTQDQETVKRELTAHTKYIDDLHAASTARISAVIKRDHSTPFGPGAYLARWQQLMDRTPITPATAHGPVRSGATKSVKEESRKDIDGKEAGFVNEEQAQKAVGDKMLVAPSSETTLRCFAESFRQALAMG